jgi:hypothetical protein
MAEDLEQVGVHVMMDLLTGDASTVFETALPEWIQSSDVALLAGTRSYALHAADPTTVTHFEAKVLEEKREKGGVIGLILHGAFNNAFPPGYSGLMNANLRTSTKYLQEFLDILFKLVGLPLDDPYVVEYKTKADLLSNHPPPIQPQTKHSNPWAEFTCRIACQVPCCTSSCADSQVLS